MKVTIITDQVELGKRADGIKASGAKLDREIHTVACSALAHLSANGDVGMVNRVYVNMPKGSRKAALSSWLLAHGSLVANTEKNKKEKPFAFTKDKATNVDAGMLDPWFDHKKDAAPDEVFDLQAAFKTFMARVSKAKDDGKLAEGQETILARLEAISATAPADAE